MQIKRHDGRRLLLSADGQDLISKLDRSGRPQPSPHILLAIGQAYALHQEVLRTGMGLGALPNCWGWILPVASSCTC